MGSVERWAGAVSDANSVQSSSVRVKGVGMALPARTVSSPLAHAAHVAKDIWKNAPASIMQKETRMLSTSDDPRCVHSTLGTLYPFFLAVVRRFPLSHIVPYNQRLLVVCAILATTILSQELPPPTAMPWMSGETTTLCLL
jgi:hypothetical protein